MKGKGEDMNIIFDQYLTCLYIYFFQETACPFFKKKEAGEEGDGNRICPILIHLAVCIAENQGPNGSGV